MKSTLDEIVLSIKTWEWYFFFTSDSNVMESANDWAHFLADMAKGQKNISTLNIFKSETENNVDNINDMMKTKTTEEENIYANDNMDELKIIEHNKSDEGGGGSEEEEYYILPNKGKIWSKQKAKFFLA